MFKLAQSPTFWLKVEFDYQAESGSRQKADLEVRCKRLPVDEVQALQERIRDEQLEDRAVARELVVGWRGVEGEDGPAEFTQEAFDELLNLGIGSPIVLAFFATYPRARAKN